MKRELAKLPKTPNKTQAKTSVPTPYTESWAAHTVSDLRQWCQLLPWLGAFLLPA